MTTLVDIYKQSINKLNDFINTVTEKQTHADTVWVFQKVLSIWVLGNILLLLPGAQEFWGPDSFIVNFDFATVSLIEKPFYLLNHPSFESYFYVVIAIQITAALALLFGKFSRLASILIFWATMTLDNKAAIILDGGNNLMHILLLLNIFMTSKVDNKDTTNSQISNTISNMSFFAARAQVAFVYFTAGIGKVTGTLWPKGVALYYTMNVNEYSHPMLGELMSQFPIMTTLGSYATLAFQLSFPFLIWYRKPRAVLLLMGTFFHLGIVFGMGLVSFGFAMCASYIVFYPNLKAKSLRSLITDSKPIIAGFDENCAICQRFAHLMKRLDWRNQLVMDGAHNPTSEELLKFSQGKRLHRIQVINKNTGEASEGLEALSEIFKVNPLTLPVTAALKLICFMGVGDFIYDKWIAQSSWRSSCEQGVCELK